MLDAADLFERFQAWLLEPVSDIDGLPREMTGVVGVAMAESGGEMNLTVFGVLPERIMRAADEAWEELYVRGVRYVMSGQFLAAAAVQGGDSIGNASGIAGTLGCVVSDDDSECDLILSCHHVLADLKARRGATTSCIPPQWTERPQG